MATVSGKLCTSLVGKDCPTLPSFLSKGSLPSLTKIEAFFEKNSGIDIDAVNQHGETALMIVCKKANKDIAQFLLEKGANPNLSAKNGYTPLHFASVYKYDMYDTNSDDEEYNFERRMARSKNRVVTADNKCLEVFKLLHDDFSAVIQPDKDGLTPINVAALNQQKFTVAHCVNKHWVTGAERIRSLEILGMVLAINYEHARAYRLLSKAKRERIRCSLPANDYKSVLECCFGRAETQTLSELQKLETSEDEIEAEGFLVGDRVLPDQLKKDFLYSRLVEDASNSMGSTEALPKAFALLSECLLLEKRGLISFGSVLKTCAFNICNCLGGAARRGTKSQQMMSHVQKILNAYPDVAREAECSELKEHVEQAVKNLANLLFTVTHRCFSIKRMDDFIAPIASLLTVIWSRIPKFHVTDDEEAVSEFRVRSVSVCHILLGMYVSRVCCKFPFGDSEHVQKRFYRIFVQLLQIEGGSDVCCCGNTMLHTLMKLPMDNINHVMDLTHLMIRYGCPRKVKNRKGEMPMDIAKGNNYKVPEELSQLLEGSTEVCSLEELAARAVLHHRIPFDDVLPDTLRDVVQDGILLEGESGFQTPSDAESDSSMEPIWW